MIPSLKNEGCPSVAELAGIFYAAKKAWVDSDETFTILSDRATGEEFRKAYARMAYYYYRHMVRYRAWLHRQKNA